MATKTFKLGEWSKGGIITVEVNKKKENAVVIAKDWDTSAGYNKGSNQSNAKEWDRKYFDLNSRAVYHDLYEYLIDLTTHYYSETIIEWVEKTLGRELNASKYF
jgi:hypothetical protein